MQIRLLKEIVSDIAGPGAEKIVDLLYNKKNVNEFLIAKKLSATINQTRNILYKLGDEGLVRFVRKKDKKKGGWYTYFWTLDSEKSLSKFEENLTQKIKKLEDNQNIKETKQFFYCKNCEIEYNEEQALLNEYTCQECGEILEVSQNENLLEEIKKEVKKHRDLLQKIQEELVVVRAKNEKAKERRLKAEKQKKDDERKKRREDKKKLVEKENRRLGIKPKKKKVAKKKVKKKVSKKKAKKKVAKKKVKKVSKKRK